MGQVRHGSATTTHAVRSAIQRSTAQQGIAVAISRERQARLAQLSRELGINRRQPPGGESVRSLRIAKTGPKEPRSTAHSDANEAMVVAFRRHTLLLLDDCLYALQPSIPHLTRSALETSEQRLGLAVSI